MVDAKGTILTNVNSTYNPPVGIGIHPRKAAEHHVEVAGQVVQQALSGSGDKKLVPNIISYSAGPGLGPCLRIGATLARAVATYLSLPLVQVHHGVGHLDLAMASTKARDPLAVLVSGGHTAILVHVGRKWLFYGETQDITLGNLLDMFAREMKLPAPGGRSVESEAAKSKRLLPLPYTVKGNDVSLSGLLTASTRLVKMGNRVSDVCYSMQEVAFSMLAEVVERSLVQTQKREVLLAGGVAANNRLKVMISEVAKDHGASFHPVPISLSGDCGAQIACSGQLAYSYGGEISISESIVVPRWRLDEVDVPWIPLS